MAKGTTIFLFFLTIVATLLFGINIGKKLGKSESLSNLQPPTSNLQPTISPTLTPKPTITLAPAIETSPSATVIPRVKGISTYTDQTCGFTFSYPGSFIRQKTVNSQSVIFTDPDNPNIAIATTCAKTIPRPPVSAEKIEAISLDGVAAMLYHDQNSDGTPRDEVIIKHPGNEMEIIIAGYGPIFQSALASFKFIK